MATSEKHNRSIDYDAAAEQLLAVLAQIAIHREHIVESAGTLLSPRKGAACRPVPSAVLCRLAFPAECRHWTHETRRRRIRDTVVVARQLLARDQADRQICADGTGYWLVCDPAGITAYAARRKRQGLTHLAAITHQITPTLAPAAGQTSLLPPSEWPPSRLDSLIQNPPAPDLFSPPSKEDQTLFKS